MEEISVFDLKDMFDREADFVLIDVREPDEYEICAIDGSVLMPLSEFESQVSRLDKSKTYIVHCKMGGRSASATQYMLNEGFKSVRNLAGGITAWANEIEPSMPLY